MVEAPEALSSLSIEKIVAGGAAPPAGELLGYSREGRQIRGYRFGAGPLRVSLIAGCHADEPVGPMLLDRLAAYLGGLPEGSDELGGATWYLVPHVNPDGETRNATWTGVTEAVRDHRGSSDRAYEPLVFLQGAVRELPGDDVEFGFPPDGDGGDHSGIRPENRAVADFLCQGAPFDLHASLHGMAFGFGPWFLVEPEWLDRTVGLRRALSRRVAAMGYVLHDVDRGGKKGFRRIEPGFSTRPDAEAMRVFFERQGDSETAAKFRPSSMEFVRRLGGDALTVVPEMPLFLLTGPSCGEGGPPLPVDGEGKRQFGAWFQKMAAAESVKQLRQRLQSLGIRGMPVRDQMRLQLALLEEGLRAVADHQGGQIS